MNRISPIEAFLTGGIPEEEFLSEVDRVVTNGSESDRTALLQDWRTKSGRIKLVGLRRRLDEKVRRLAWTPDDDRIRANAGVSEHTRTSVQVGDILANRFVIESKIGSGGMGTVFRALDLRRQEALDRRPYVAVKTLSTEVLSRDDSVQILQREARKAQGLAHPNIIQIYDFDRDGPILFLTMELLEGVSLEATIRNASTGVPLATILPIIEQIVSALEFAHGEGIVHYDLKPANIIVLPNGRVKVIDFGIARAIPKPNALTGDRTTFEIAALGAITPAYASPEMIEGIDPDPRDDVFALTCVVFECLTGRHPFGRMPASMAQAANLVPPKPPNMEAHIWNALLKGLHFERSLRTPTPMLLLRELTTQERTRPKSRRAIVYAVILGLGASFIAGGTAYYFLTSAGGDIKHLREPSASQTTNTTLDSVEGKSETASQQAKQNAADEAAAQEAKQKAADEAAAQQAKQKAADEAAAQQAKQKAADEAAAQQAKQKAADEAAAQQAKQKAADEAAAQQAKQKAADAAAAQQAKQKAADAAAAQQAKQKAADAAAATRPALSAPTGRFNGVYVGTFARSGWFNVPNCTTGGHMSVTISDNHFNRRLLGVPLSADIGADGTISASGDQHVELTGKIDGKSLVLDYNSLNCHYHAELLRVP
jgi:serine/threonine protein kinase